MFGKSLSVTMTSLAIAIGLEVGLISVKLMFKEGIKTMGRLSLTGMKLIVNVALLQYTSSHTVMETSRESPTSNNGSFPVFL